MFLPVYFLVIRAWHSKATNVILLSCACFSKVSYTSGRFIFVSVVSVTDTSHRDCLWRNRERFASSSELLLSAARMARGTYVVSEQDHSNMDHLRTLSLCVVH